MSKVKTTIPKTNFFVQVYEIVKTIPQGKVMTYGQIAQKLNTRDSRRVGHALHANSDKNTPCHRVVNKDGRLAPGYAFGGPDEQKSRLLSEGAVFKDDGYVDLDKSLFNS